MSNFMMAAADLRSSTSKVHSIRKQSQFFGFADTEMLSRHETKVYKRMTRTRMLRFGVNWK